MMQKRIHDSIEISKKGPGCKQFWQNLKGKKNNRDIISSLKIPNSNDVTYDKNVMNQSIMHHFQTVGKMNLNLSNQFNNCNNHNSSSNNDINCNIKSINELFHASFTSDCRKHEGLNDFQFSLDDVKTAINHCKNNKSPGIDCITNELLKNGGEIIARTLNLLFAKLKELEDVPEEWNKGIIVPIFKKGDKKDLNNYRGITLNSCVSKIYNRLITKSISSYLEENNLLSEIQGGFRADHRCEDHIFTLKSIISCRRSEKKHTYLAFLDFKKAFDSVWREGLLNAVWEIGIRGRIWRVISNMYNNVQSQVKFGDITTDFFQIDEGVKQGCVLSPILFCIFINELAKRFRESEVGARICNIQVGCLFWADDIVLIAEDKTDLQKMLDIAATFAKQRKLEFNHDKSNVVIVGQRGTSNIKWALGDKVISEVNQYKYLGVQISNNISDHKHIDEVIRKGNKIIAYIRSIIDGQDDFNRVFYGDVLWKSLGMPVINYACSVWIPNSFCDINRIENLQVRMAKSILKAPRNMTKEAMYADLGWSPLTSTQDKFRIDFFDRLLTMSNERWPKLLFNAMYLVHREHNTQWKWLGHIKGCLERCGFDHMFSNDPERNRGWVHVYEKISKHLDLSDWFEKARNKSSLNMFLSLKDNLNQEIYLLDSTNFYGASLKLRARTNTLQLERYIRSWSSANDGLCKLCNRREDETIDHFMFQCMALQAIRVQEFHQLERNLNVNHLEVFWETFMAHDNNVKLYMMLGDLYKFGATLGEIFDKSCKSFLKALWDERKRLLNASE